MHHLIYQQGHTTSSPYIKMHTWPHFCLSDPLVTRNDFVNNKKKSTFRCHSTTEELCGIVELKRSERVPGENSTICQKQIIRSDLSLAITAGLIMGEMLFL